MAFTALTCPQCGGALPRQALWRMVACTYCKAMVTRSAEVVERAPYQLAYQRSLSIGDGGGRRLRIAGQRYRVLTPLGQGEHSEVLLAERCGALPQRVTIKLAHSAGSDLAREAETLRQLQALQGAGAAYFSQRLPQVVALGRTGEFEHESVHEREALVLRHPTGFWGSLSDVLRMHPHGLSDARHAVWLWRRVLELLGYIHGAGWSHGDVRAQHCLVNPGDHGVLVIGWSRAALGGDTTRDLMQLAWTIRTLLHGESDDQPGLSSQLPLALSTVLRAASEDAAWCARLGAQGIDQALVSAARESFGPPQFIPFNPLRA
ncbi:MAG: protein kinase family protein [Rhizobacter sp.]